MLLLLTILVFGAVNAQQGEKLSFTSPELSNEEQFSTHMPDNLKCDACKAVAYQMTQGLENAEKKFGNKKLKESDYLEVFEKVCDSKTWENYGLKSVDGVNRLSGKGLHADDVPGMMYGGGKWPGRLMEKCYEFIDVLGEDRIYNQYKSNSDLKQLLCKQHTKDCVLKTKKAKKEL